MKQVSLLSLCVIANFGLAASVAAQDGMMDRQESMMGGGTMDSMMSGRNS